MKSIVHWDDAQRRHKPQGEISSTWTMLGESVGSVGVGLRRIEIDPGCRSTPAHVHGAEEEIFFVLGGSGLLLQGASSCEVSEGDCIVELAGGETHTLRAGPGGLDALAFGTRVPVELCYLPRIGMAWAGPTVVAAPGLQDLWAVDAAEGTLQFPPPGPRPANVISIAAAPSRQTEKGGSRASWSSLGRAAGSLRTGLNHVRILPGSIGAPPHCHSAEEEIFVILDGAGVCVLGAEESPVRRGHVVSRPPGTGVAHSFRAGEQGLEYLAYGTREPNDITYYPRSGKVFFRGVGVIGRIEPLDYWDGET